MNYTLRLLGLGLLCACLLMACVREIPNEDEDNQTADEVCADPAACEGAPPTCICSTGWTCGSEPGACAKPMAPPGEGKWSCSWSSVAYTCQRPGSANEQSPETEGWTCTWKATDSAWSCESKPPVPDVDLKPAMWTCGVVNDTASLVCRVIDADDVKLCPDKEQHVLVLDFRSGWWGGIDGVIFHKTALSSLEGPCGANVFVTYKHYVGTQLTAKAPVIDDKVDQVWILSGANGDGADLVTDTPLFKKIMALIIASKANVFIGAGCGFVDHANALCERLGLGEQFVTSKGFIFFAPLPGTYVATTIKISKDAQKHPLFEGVTRIADEMRNQGPNNSAGARAFSDSLRTPNSRELIISEATSKVTILATNKDKRLSIGVAKTAGRKVVLDAGLQRLYAIAGDQSKIENRHTMRYLRNIVRFLSTSP